MPADIFDCLFTSELFKEISVEGECVFLVDHRLPANAKVASLLPAGVGDHDEDNATWLQNAGEELEYFFEREEMLEHVGGEDAID